MDYRSRISYQGHIKDEPLDGYERGFAQDITLPERGATWPNPSELDSLRQTFVASNHDAHDIDTSSKRVEGALNGAFSSLPHQSVSEGNTFHVPPFRCLAETAGAGEFHLSSPPIIPAIQARHDLASHLFNYQAPIMPPDGAFLHSSSSLLRHPSRLPGQYELPNFCAQESPYALETGHTYPRHMPAPRVSPTINPSRLNHRPSPIPSAQEDSASESDVEMVNGGRRDHGRNRQLDADDAAGWKHHPDTIGLGTPDFYETKTQGDMCDAAGVHVPVVIHARFVLKKKAARQRDFWILYRRNYFGIQGSYNLEGLPGSSPDETLYLYRNNHKPKPIQALFMCMRGVVETEEGPEIKIVVFNAKRKPIHEGKEPPPIEPQRMKPLTEGSTKFYAESTGDRHDHMKVPMNHTFHRNQFRAATQNNGARRTEQQFYHILLELKAEVMVDGASKLFTVASKMSEPLVVRGRCPLSFKEKDKDGQIRDSDPKGRRPPRDGSGFRSRRCSTAQSQKEGQTKGASRAFCPQTGNSSRRSTRSSSTLPSLAGTRSLNTNPLSPLQTSYIDGTVRRDTVPHLNHGLLTLTPRECDPSWPDSHDSS